MGVRLLLITQEGDALEAYRQALTDLGVDFDSIYSLLAIQSSLLEKPYNGLLVDVDTMACADRIEKETAKELLDLFPVIRLNFDPGKKIIRTLYYGEVGEGSTSLKEFLEKHCQDFPRRSIRRSIRRALHFNVLLSRRPDFPPELTWRTNTIDVSEDGCFVYTIEEWEPNTDVWLKSDELDDPAPIQANIRWQAAWGSPMQMPGIGLEFSQISETQRTALRRYIFPYTNRG